MIREKLSKIVAIAAERAVDVRDVAVEVDYADEKFGDFATNVALKLAKQTGKNPREVAGILARELPKDSRGLIVSAEVAGPGFINMRLSADYWRDALSRVGDWAIEESMGGGQRVQVEFISANPTGPLTLGNARGGFIGDVLSRVLSATGYEVTREFYFNDAGTQITKLVESVKAAAGLIDVEEVQYRGSYIQELADEYKAELSTGDDGQLGGLITQAIINRYTKPAIERMGISFDEWFNERTLVSSGAFEKALKRLRELGLIYDKENAVWLASTSYGDERDRVLVKSNGDITYLGNDIAYHINIFEERGFDRAIKEWGADHAGQIPSLRLTMKKVLPDKQLDFVVHQFVRLIKDGKEFKISKRAGTFVTVDDLLEEVGADVARFFVLMRSADSHMDFDLSLAREQSQKNPYYYVMYSYVRAGSILAKANTKELAPSKPPQELTPPEMRLVKKFDQLGELMLEIAHESTVHKLSFYAQDLAALFHDFYESEKIIELPKKSAEEKLYIVARYRMVLDKVFDLLGITPLDKMEHKGPASE